MYNLCFFSPWNINGTVSLTFALLTPKTIRVFYSTRTTILWSLKALAQMVTNYWAETILTFKVTVTLTFDQLIPKTIIILSKTNHPMQCGTKRYSSNWAQTVFSFKITVILTSWPQKAIEILFYIKAIIQWRLKALGQKKL